MSFVLPERLTLSNANATLAAGEKAIAQGLHTFDLGALQRVDSSAVAVLLGWVRFAQRQSLPLAFTHIPADLHSLITLYGVDEVLDRAGATS